MDEATLRDQQIRDFLALLPDFPRDFGQAGVGEARSFRQRMYSVLTVYALTVAGASAAFFVLGVLLRCW